MAFKIENLNPIGGQSKPCKSIAAGALGKGGPQLWSYITEDAAAAVDSAGYFNAAYDLLNLGDVILRVTVAAGAVSTAGFHLVNGKANGQIDVTDALALTTTDTD